MMSYEKWLDSILQAAHNIGSRAFQAEAWKAGGNVVSSPDEVYQVFMEDCTPDLFFEIYGAALTDEQVRSWSDLKLRLTGYYDRMSLYPDPTQVLTDPEWELVRQAARRFVLSFNRHTDDVG
jgi:hypothetical protein